MLEIPKNITNYSNSNNLLRLKKTRLLSLIYVCIYKINLHRCMVAYEKLLLHRPPVWTFVMFPTTYISFQSQCNCNKLHDDLVRTNCNPINATFNMFQCNSNFVCMQPNLLRVVSPSQLYQPHIFHMKCVREMKFSLSDN